MRHDFMNTASRPFQKSKQNGRILNDFPIEENEIVCEGIVSTPPYKDRP